MRKIALLFLAACTTSEPELGSAEQGIISRCGDPDFCGTNSPLMTQYGVWEFNVRGAYNGQGWRVLGLADTNHRFYNLTVADSRIVGTDAGGRPALFGQELIGARIYLDVRGVQSAIVISDIGQVGEVVSKNKLETYVLDWGVIAANPLPGVVMAGHDIGAIPVLKGTESVCPEPTWTDEPYAGSLSEWDFSYYFMSPYHSLVFEGDRFDPATRTVAQKPDNDWFNIGCGTSSLAKLRLTRNTINTAPDWRHVQAALKMLGADYCGGGTTFTFPDEPLVWQAVSGMSYYRPPNELEARWDENGATCVNAPRLVNSGNPAVAATYNDVWQAIEEECRNHGRVLDKCADVNSDDPFHTYGELVTSGNYD